MANKWRDVPLPASSYSDDAKSWTDQDWLGWMPVNAELAGGRSNVIGRQVPGLQEFAAVPGATRQRGARNVEGRLYFVADTSFCQLLPSGAVAILGTIPGRSRVSMSHNQILNGNEVFITTGTAGYIWNTVTSTLTQITDDGFLGGLLSKFIGSRFLTLDPSRRFFQCGDLVDGTSWSSLNYFAGESSPDRIRSIEVVNNEVVLLSESSMEHFAYQGDTNTLFANKGIALDRGCASTHAVSTLDNALFFLGNDGSGYEKRGYEIRRITTHAIEQAWALCDLSKAYSFTFEDKGHKVWYVTFPDGYTWGYDVATRAWHRRSSYGMDRWRIAWMQPWNGGIYAGEYNSGRVFRLDWDYPLEGADPLPREVSPGVLHRDGNRVALHGLRAQVEAGPSVAATSVLPLAFVVSAPVLNVGGRLADGAVGDVVSFRYLTVGGVAPVTFAVTTGALPAGLTLDATTGELSGTYTTAEHDNAWTMTATDAAGTTATLSETQYVMDMTGTPPNAINGAVYSFSFTGTEGTSPYTFALASGTLPTGLSLASSGAITGTPTVDGLSTFTVTMTDDAGVTQTKPYSITVAALVVEVTGSFGYCVDNYVSAWMNGTLFRSEVLNANGSPITIPAALMTPTGNKLVIKCRDTGIETYAAFTLSVTGTATTQIINANTTGFIYKEVANTDVVDYSAGVTGGTAGGQTPFASNNSSIIAAANGWPQTRHGIWTPLTHLWLGYDFDLP